MLFRLKTLREPKRFPHLAGQGQSQRKRLAPKQRRSAIASRFLLPKPTKQFWWWRLKKTAPKRTVMQEEIACLAYSYWEARGCQGGSPHEDWIRAERELYFR